MPLTFSRVALLLLLSLSFATPARAQDAQAAPTPEKARPKGFITGRVVSEDGQPLAGVRVYAQSNRAGGAAITKADGTFKIENLERAPYLVNAYAPGFFDTSYLEYERGVRRFQRAGDHVTVTLARGGVITGRVMDAKGEPAMGVRVNMVRVRTPDNKPVQEVNRFMRSLERMTDDRGVYRNYGLLPGVYVVSAAGRFSQDWGPGVAHSEEAPTFYPSTTRDAAAEVTLRAGEEVSDVDIRLRGERGYAISGTVAGVMDAAHAEQATMIALISASTTEYQGQAFFHGRAGVEGFAFDSLTDGEYDLVAERYASEGWRKLAVASRRVQIKGADVTGLKLTFLPVGSISGRLVFEKPATPEVKTSTTDSKTLAADSKPASVEAKTECAGSAEELYGDSLVLARRVGGTRTANEPSMLETSPDDKGDFALRGLGAGAYRLDVRLGEGYFVTSVRTGAVAAGKTTTGRTAATTTAGATVNLRQGEDASGVVLTASYGAASLKGRVTFPACDYCPEAPTRVYLVPLERERADDLLRYAEAEIVRDKSSGGDFSFDRIAPGRYKLVAPPVAQQAAPEQQQPLFFSDEGRALLRRESERSDVSVTLAPCQSASGVSFIYVPPDKGGAGERRDK
ncbi:MAG TPA: carboxypeptidase-like regulatory domain-containing protein [Pyrinomonadaceae bacterium]|nr:carboxypeptidase-like regulatory domain-containing protein [Pyrinomonadaceae bacterium]